MTSVTATAKFDIKKDMPELYSPRKGVIEHVLVPQLSYVAISGKGSPDGAEFQTAMGALYAVAYPLKFHSKNSLGRDYVVGPAEGLWWADDPGAFASGEKSQWQWTLLSVVPQWIHEAEFGLILDAAKKKAAGAAERDGSGTSAGALALLHALENVHLLTLAEGQCLQVLHIGPYSAEAKILSTIHDEVMPAEGLTFNGPHHEIYLGDPRRTAPEKLRTILRQPVTHR